MTIHSDLNDTMQKCASCANKDNERSSENWLVCFSMPLSVAISKDSSECENYKPKLELVKGEKE